MKAGTEVYVRGNTFESPDARGTVVSLTVHGWPCVKFEEHSNYPEGIAYPPWRVAEVADGKPWWRGRSRKETAETGE